MARLVEAQVAGLVEAQVAGLVEAQVAELVEAQVAELVEATVSLKITLRFNYHVKSSADLRIFSRLICEDSGERSFNPVLGIILLFV